jgi:predicted RNase H-like HicB family nuclease
MSIRLIEKSRTESKSPSNEEIYVSKNKLSIKLFSITGKDGDFWVSICPSLNVSGYGSSKEEAEASLDHNMNVFAEDFSSLPIKSMILELKKMGWEQAKFRKKRLSKVFVDEDGNLQNLEHAELRRLESVA